MKKQLLAFTVLSCGLVLAVNVNAQTCGLKPVELPPLGLTNPVQVCSCKSNMFNCGWVWVSSNHETHQPGLDSSIFGQLSNYDPSRTVAETKQQEDKAKLLRQQTQLLQQQTEALRLENEKRRRQASDAEQAKIEAESDAAARAAQEELAVKFKASIAMARLRHPDFDIVANRDDVTMTPTMMRAIVESDAGGELVYYFGQHPEEGARIAKLSPVSSVREIGKIEGRLIPAN